MSYSRSSVRRALLIPIIFVAILWAIKGIEILLGVSFADYGLLPRHWVGLRGILFSPFLHGGIQHLAANTLPVVILGFVMFTSYQKVAWRALAWIWVLTGIWVWIGARANYHIGVSGIIYGMATFIVLMGVLRKDTRSLALAGLVAFLYGGLVWGILPLDPQVSWESHLLGGVAGIFAAIMYYKVEPMRDPDLNYRPEEIRHLPYWMYEVEGDLKQDYRPVPPPEQPQPQFQYRFVPRKKEPEDDAATSRPEGGE